MPISIQPSRRTIVTGLYLACLLCTTNTSHADLIAVINPSFEDISGEVAYNEFTFGPLNGWQLYDPGPITNGGAGNTFFPLAGFPDYRVDLLAGGQVIASDNSSLANTIPEGAFATSTLQFTTDTHHPLLGQALGIRLVNLNSIDPLFPNSDLEIDFDNVRLSATAVVPEPSSQLVLLVVLSGLQFSRVRLRRRFLQVRRT